MKIRYENQEDIPEYPAKKLPLGWKKKLINGVNYYKDPSGKIVFNSLKLVADYLRLSDEDLVSIMEESDTESDLSESESEASDMEEMREKRRKLQCLPDHGLDLGPVD